MVVPQDATIPEEKLTKYLLVPRPWDDKSKYLEQAGYDRENAETLMLHIRHLVSEVEAIEDGRNDYGILYLVKGNLHGPNGRDLPVVTVWLRWHIDGSFHFVTLKPWRNKPS